MKSNVLVNTLDYASPLPRGRRFWIGPTIAWALAVWGWIFISLAIIPRFERIFRDFKISLPLVSIAVLESSRWTNQSYGWAILCVLPGLIPLLVGTSNPNTPDRPNALSRVWLWLGMLLCIVVFFWSVLGVAMPMLTLFGAVTGSSKK